MALFSKRHYNFCANALSRIHSEQFRNDIAEEFAEIFASDNPLFERETFFTNCNLDAWRNEPPAGGRREGR